jgi:hypothetical protein
MSAGGVAGVTVVAGEVVAAVSSRFLQPVNSAHTIALQKTILLVMVNGAVMIFPFG